MFERYNEKARRVVFFARYEASEYRSPYIETEHLLFGIVREAKYVLTEIAPSAPADFERRWRDQVQPFENPKVSVSVDLPLSNESKRVLAYAAEEADWLEDRHIGVEHLLLGLLRERTRASEMLGQIGITLEKARERFAFRSYAVPHPSSGESAPGIPFVQFVDATGAHLAVLPVGSMTHLPREGDVVEFETGSRFVVNEVRYVFEPVSKRWSHKDHELAKIVVGVERVQE